jgi:aspartate dehydrogenase
LYEINVSLRRFFVKKIDSMNKKLKLALIGGGFLNEIVARAMKDGFLPEYELVAVLDKKERTGSIAKVFDCKVCDNIEALLAEKPDYTAEAASVEAVRSYAQTVLDGGSHLIVLSIGAFADASFYRQVKETAAANNRKVYIASGAVGGFDVLRTASLMGPITASITALKSPEAVSHTPLNFDGILNITEQTEVFWGTTKEAIAILPTHVNVAVATALASAGPEETTMDIHVLPDGYQGDEYHIKIEGEEVRINLQIYSRTSAIAAWSVVATLQNIVSPIEFF